MIILQGLEDGKQPLEAMQSLQFAWLPAAAELPAFLLQNPASVSPLPDLQWFPQGADEELQVIPASSLPITMRANMQRAPTGFAAVAGDHYRIGLVVGDDDYRPGLLQLPVLEEEVIELLHRNARACENATIASQDIWNQLAVGFAMTAHPEIAGVPDQPPMPESADAVLQNLGAQEWRAKSANANTHDMIAPYHNTWPNPPVDLPAQDTLRGVESGLLAEYVMQTKAQDDLSEMLEDIDDLLEMLENEKKQQRGLVDTLTIDLARLAGGVAGDGSGIKMANAAREVRFTKKEE